MPKISCIMKTGPTFQWYTVPMEYKLFWPHFSFLESRVYILIRKVFLYLIQESFKRPILNLKTESLLENYSIRKGKSGRKKNAPQ